MISSCIVQSPYPGLRPFARHEAHIFFGRETHVDAMVDRLARRRVLTVTGSSGSGKSSLVRAGLLEALETGLLAPAGSLWRFATMRPGEHPKTELAGALADVVKKDKSDLNVALLQARLDRGPLSLVEELRQKPLPDGTNLLILVDQVEELFRFQGLAAREEAEGFIALLLASALQDEVPIYVVLTLRSNFLGFCADFEGLAEVVSESQYLCPRLSREQIATAIKRPAQVFGGVVEKHLVTRILNDMGMQTDQLPLMQHVLSRLWDRAEKDGQGRAALRLQNYLDEGGLEGSLSRHADEILEEVADTIPEGVDITRRLFCLLTEGEGENATRRLSPVSEIINVTSRPFEVITAIADRFRAGHRSFLMPSDVVPLDHNTFLDISHESLIRQWGTLADWTRGELASADRYGELARRAQRWKIGEADLLDGIDLDTALIWRDAQRPTAAWANRYGGDFSLTMQFLDESRDRRVKEQKAIEDRRAEVGLTEARFLTQKAQDALRDNQPELAALIARAALPASVEAPDRPLWYPAVSVLTEARCYDRQPAVLRGHGSFVNCAAFSPDGCRVVTASADKTARVWDATTGALLMRLGGHEAEVNSAFFSASGLLVLTASADHTALLWDVLEPMPILTFKGHTSFVTFAIFSPDGNYVLTASADCTARIWNANTGEQVTILGGHTAPLTSVAYSPDGTRIVSGSNDCTIRQWDATTGTEVATLLGHDRSVHTVAFSPDGARIISASADGTVRQWDTVTGAPIILQIHTAEVNSAFFSSDGTHIVTASADHTARLWDSSTGDEIAALQGHGSCVNRAAFNPSGSRVVTASADGSAGLWDVSIDTQVTVLSGHTRDVVSCAFSPDSLRVVTGSFDNTARVWDVISGTQIAILGDHAGGVNSVTFDSTGALILTASADHTARVWDATEYSQLAVLQGHESFVNYAAFNPNTSRVITAAADHTSRLWDPRTGELLATLVGHKSFVNTAAFSPDGASVVTASADQTAKIWRDGALVTTLDGHTSYVNVASFSADGRRIVTGSADHTARLWEVASGVLVAVLRGHTDAITSAGFSPDGRYIVTASADHTARLWDAITGVPLTILTGHRSFVRSAVVSADSRRVITASADRTARLWDAATGAQIAVMHGHNGPIHAAAFAPGGTRVATASADCSARMWPLWPLLTVESVIYSETCAMRSLTCAERTSLFFSERDETYRMPKPAPTGSDPGIVCDMLAANAFDPRARFAGVDFKSIDVENAIPACRVAAAGIPNEPRFRYHLGRALASAGRLEEAVKEYVFAAKAGYAAAQCDLGFAYETGAGVNADIGIALRLYRQAARGGCVTAHSRLGRCYWEGIGVPKAPGNAIRWFERGLEAGDPFSHRRMAELYESGEYHEPDFEKALLHHAIATRLFEEAGEESEAIGARARRGAIARAMPPEVVVIVARQATAWRPTAL